MRERCQIPIKPIYLQKVATSQCHNWWRLLDCGLMVDKRCSTSCNIPHPWSHLRHTTSYLSRPISIMILLGVMLAIPWRAARSKPIYKNSCQRGVGRELRDILRTVTAISSSWTAYCCIPRTHTISIARTTWATNTLYTVNTRCIGAGCSDKAREHKQDGREVDTDQSDHCVCC
jgi:hypothetical protein